MKSLIIPILLIVLGLGWLLSNLGMLPEINWVWTLGLAAVGVWTFAQFGFDKVSVVLGPIFLAASLLSFLRQSEVLEADIEVPILVCLTGVLLLVARSSAVPSPAWLPENAGNKSK